MKNEKPDAAVNSRAEAGRDKQENNVVDDDRVPENRKSIEERRKKHDADSGSDGSMEEILQKEIRIDPGNEHHHRTDADDKIFDEDIDRSPRYDADAGNDGTGTMGPDPGE